MERKECEKCNHSPVCKEKLKQALTENCPYYESNKFDYIDQVLCRKDECYQFCTKGFVKESKLFRGYKIKIIEKNRNKYSCYL